MGIDWSEFDGINDIDDDDNFVPAKNRVIRPLGDNDFLIFEDDAPADDQAFLDEMFLYGDEDGEGLPHDMLEEAFLFDTPCKKTDLIKLFHHDNEQIIVFLEAVSALELYAANVGMKSGTTFQGDEYIGVYVGTNNYYKFVAYPLLKTIQFYDGKSFSLSLKERTDIYNEVIKKI